MGCRKGIKMVEIVNTEKLHYSDKKIYLMKHGEVGLIKAVKLRKELLGRREIKVVGPVLAGKDFYFIYLDEPERLDLQPELF